MIQANFTVTPSAGDVGATEFTFTDTTSGASVYRYVWGVGNDNLIYQKTNFSYTFKYPGVYNITLSATDFDGNQSEITKQVSVDLVHRDYLKFTQIPEEYANPGKKTKVPFKFEVLSSNPDKPLLVDLFVANSGSIPYQYTPEKWNFLNPTWKFLDKNNSVVTTLSIDPIKIYKNNKVVAVSGVGEFYYIDSLSTGNPTTNCPLLITATLQTSAFSNPLDSSVYAYNSYANNESVRSALVWQVNDTFPTRLKVTGNYLDPINEIQWKNVKIPVLITAHSNRSDLIPGSQDELSEVIFSYPKTNEQGTISEIFASKEIQLRSILDLLSLDPVGGYILLESGGKIPLEISETYNITVINTLAGGDQYVIDDDPIYFQSTDSNGFKIGGYIFTTVTTLSTIKNAAITLSTFGVNVQRPTNNFVYPEGFSPNPSVWISNPAQNALNKITLVPNNGNCETINYFKNKKLLVEGTVKEVKVPKLESVSDFNYPLSGFSGIGSIAVDPRNYDIVAADVELDRIYKISNSGEILKTFSLSSLNDFDSQKKMFDFWTWKTPSQSLSSSNFTFYSPAFRSTNLKNYIVTLDGLIWPTGRIKIRDFQTIRIYTPSGVNPYTRPRNSNLYPPEDLDFSVIQIFNPLLPNQYTDSLSYWDYTTITDTSSFALTGTVLNDVNRYIVSVDGFYQPPTTYSVDSINNTLDFNTPVNANSVVNIHYFDKSLTPAFWEFNLTSKTNFLPLTGNSNYVPDEHSGFIVSVDKRLIKPTDFALNVEETKLTFNYDLSAGSDVYVTQITVDESVNVPAAYTPSSLSIDKNYNIWVTLFDTVSVLKLDPDFNLLFSTVPTNIHWDPRSHTKSPDNIDYQSSVFGIGTRYNPLDTLEDDTYSDDFFLKPSFCETDKNNNCWVTYSNPLCSLLVKYNPQGVSLAEIPTGHLSTPTSISVNAANNIWVANTHNSSYFNTPLSGSIDLYDTQTYTKTKSVTGISRPYHLSIDRSNNLWFCHGLRRIGYYNTTTNQLSSWILDLSGGFTVFEGLTGNDLTNFDEIDNEENNELGGLAVDVYDRVWILDSTQNTVWVINASPHFGDSEIRYFKAIPQSLIGYYNDINNNSIYTKSENYSYESIKAIGDWTGNRWYQKYVTSSTLSSVLLSGVSNTFSVLEFEDKNQIKRINESFNNAEYLKNLALPENLKNNPVLFDKIFAGSVGTGYLSGSEDLGQTIYEKIANFVPNHSDVDTCNIEQLLSLAEEVEQPIEDYGGVFPAEIKRLIDIFSVPRSKLWGLKEQKALFPQSIGTEYKPTDFIEAGEKIIAKNKFDNTIKVIDVPVQNNQTSYQLSTFLGYGLKQPIFSNYLFYRYTPVYSNKYIENIIDWDAEYTTLNPEISSYQSWYGDGGSIETAFRYLLTKNLFVK